MNKVCYIPLKGVDDVIAAHLGWKPTATFNPAYRVATLRGMYDEANEGSPLDTSDPAKAAQALKTFRNQMARKSLSTMSSIGTHLHAPYLQLRRTFTAEERFNRVNMLTTMFSMWVDRIKAANPTKSRAEIIGGYTENGRPVAGEFAIFEMVYNELIDMHAHYMQLGTPEGKARAAKIKQIFDNWAPLTAFVRMKLRDTEGVKVGNTLEWSDEADLDSFCENNLSELFNMPESKRESWQEMNDMKSSFGSVGKNVRRLISCLPKYVQKNGKDVIDVDDLGFPIMLDPVKVHQALMNDLRGITSESQMMRAFFDKEGNLKHSWLKPIVQKLRTDNRLRTQFFVDFKKGFQLYSKLISDEELNKKGLNCFKTFLMNKVENLLGGEYLTRVQLKTPINKENSVFDENGKVNWKNLQKVRSLLTEWLNPGPLKVAKWYAHTSRIEKRAFLLEVSEALGMPVDADTIESIMGNPSDLKEYLKNLKQALIYGINSNITKEVSKKLEAGNYSIGSKDYMSFLTAKNSANGSLKEKIDKMLTLITKNREGLRLESRVRHINAKGKGVTLFSDINPSYMDDRFSLIRKYVEENDKLNFKKFLDECYLSSSYFKDSDGTILNVWLEELYKCCDENGPDLSETFAAEFIYMRDLGSSDIAFENFTEKYHMIDMFTRFFSDRQISSNADTAQYPIFILGDSGVSKYIRAGVYSRKDILDGLYKVWRQEQRRMKLTEAANKLLKDGNHKSIDNFSQRKAGEYTLLPFLNNPKYAKLLGNQTEAEVKAAISAYMEDSVEKFKQSLNNMGMLETKIVQEWDPILKKNIDVERYINLPKNITPANLDESIADFYWNTKFATIEQIQLMTIDTAFYGKFNKDTGKVEGTTKDFQKRYKEIHAPGTALSIEALDNDGKRFSEDGIERCIYFDDIEINSEKTNPDFMKAILYQYATVDRSKVDKAIADGVLIPIEGDTAEDKAKERARNKRLESLLGKNYDIYKKYTRNTLTDGQGYRTLRSYRKVMGMAGQWTDEMEHAFREIESIRSSYGKDKIPAKELKRIADLAVVFQPIKPYMFTHEVLPINNNDNLLIPVQHKYAEAVLIPELLPQESKLRAMAYYMDENNIDLIGSTKIVKVGCFGSTDIKGVTNAEDLNAALSKGYVHKLRYSDYRIQTNVPDHAQASRLFGTQVRKLIMAGVKMDKFDDGHYASYIDSEYVNLGGTHGNVKMNGRNLISFYNSLIVANIMESLNTFLKNTDDVEKLSDQLIQSVINNSRESWDNILSYGINEDDFAVALFEAGLEHDTANLVLSIFKKLVNKQTIQGNSLVQVSAMGISDYEEDGGLKFVTDDNGNVLYAECEIPWDLTYIEKDENGHDRTVALDFNDYCNEDGTLKLDEDGIPLIEKKLPGVTSMVAYRIPTERDYSMINLKVVRFSPKTAGGTIKVPAEGTTIAGFDFDVDKLYLMRREYRSISPEARYSKKDAYDIFANIYSERPDIESALIAARKKYGKESDPLHTFWNHMLSDNPSFASDSNYNKDILFRKSAEKLGIAPKVTDQVEFEEYDFTKPPMSYEYTDASGNKVWVEGNTRAARNNMLIHLIQQRLMDPETFKQRYTPGGFANASKAARIMRELLHGDMGSINRLLANSDQPVLSLLESRVNDDNIQDPEPDYDPSDPMTIIIYNQQNQVAGKLIGIFANQNTNHAFASLMKTFKLSVPIEFAGHSYGDFLTPPPGIDVDLNVAELLSASVDAVKDPVLNFMNLNTITADAGAVLARIGYTTQEIGILFNQPIIKKLCEYCLNNGVGIDIALRDVKAELLNMEGVRSVSKTNPSDFTVDKLVKNIIKDRTEREAGGDAMQNAAFVSEQLKVLELFNTINTISSNVSKFVTSTKFTASNAVGSTFGDLYAQQIRVDKYLEEVASENNIIMEVTDMIKTPLNNDHSLLNMSDADYFDTLIDNPFAYEQAMYDANRKALRHLSKYFPYSNSCYSKARDTLGGLLKYGTLDADTINSIHSDLMVYLLSQEEHSDFNGELPKFGTEHLGPNGTPPTIREYYTKYFVTDLFKELEGNPSLKDLAIFKYMVFDTDSKGNVRTSVQGIGGLAPYKKDEIRESWADLNSTHPELAKDLFLYNFYKLGFQFSPGSFMNLAPTEVKQSISVPNRDGSPRSYVQFLKDVKNDKIQYNASDFAIQYILNHPDNEKFVFNTNKSKVAKDIISKLAFSSTNEAMPSFSLDISKYGDDAGLFLIKSASKDDPINVFKPVISIRGALYVAQSGGLEFNKTGGTSMRYVRMDQQGSKGVSMSYKGDSSILSASSTNSGSERASLGNTNNESEQTPLGNSSQEPGPGPVNFDREAAISEISQEMIKAYKAAGLMMEEESGSKIIAALEAQSDQNLSDTIEAIRKACRKDGILLLDADGNLLQGC